MKKPILLFLSVLIFSVSLSGCGKNIQTAPQNEKTEASENGEILNSTDSEPVFETEEAPSENAVYAFDQSGTVIEASEKKPAAESEMPKAEEIAASAEIPPKTEALQKPTDEDTCRECETEQPKCEEITEADDLKPQENENISAFINRLISGYRQTPKTPYETEKTPSSPESASETAEVFRIVNEERQKNGLSSLEYRTDLQPAADLRAKEIAVTFSHTRPDGSSCFTVLGEMGVTYRSAGENIAYGQRSAEEVMNGWMNSKGHRENILSNNFTGMAVGQYIQNGVKYWVQIFIK